MLTKAGFRSSVWDVASGGEDSAATSRVSQKRESRKKRMHVGWGGEDSAATSCVSQKRESRKKRMQVGWGGGWGACVRAGRSGCR